ncbi:AMP-binding protein [Micromonospora sp. KC723]|uniref:non-ribosomal peptide synthetase n=1 Tax=Micromonospora sp. KC723 TaxID=2530381 RepID=UPI00104F50DC|nr:AMP-binding protein [Micromonospora sp. KC723]TDB76412.1 hypothetical protein E1165_07115 [Micromonospora sp. KC723]
MNVRRTEYETLVTSSAQDRSWYLHRLVPESAEQNRCRQYVVVGPLDLAAVRRAWAVVSGRHEILRTVYREVDGCPVPVVRPDADAALRVVDARALWPWPDSEEAADQLVAGWMGTPFDPATGLISIRVLVLTDTRARLLLVADAMICDEASVGIIARDLAAAYVAAVDGTDQDGTDDVVQYRAVAAAERQALVRSAGQRTPDWVSALDPAAGPLDLPVDRGRPQGPAPRSGGARFDWPPEVAGRVTRAATAVGVDRRVVFLAAFHALLHRYDRSARVAIAMPATTRTEATRAAIGPFDNPMVVAVEFRDVPTFRQLLETVQRQVHEGLRYRMLPFDHVVRLAGADRDPRRPPLYDAVFVCHDGPEAPLDLGSARGLPVPLDNATVQADLSLRIHRCEPSVAGSVRYRTDMFDHASAARIAAQLRTFVEAATERLDDPIDTIPLERHDELLAAVRDADRVEDGAVTPVHDIVAGLARRSPDAPAVAWSSAAVTYRELWQRAGAAAAVLRKVAGADRLDGVAVAVRITPSPSFAVAALAVLQTGAYLVCLGADDSGERDRAVLGGLRPLCLLVSTAPAGVDGTADDGFAAWYRDECGGTVLDLADVRGDGTGPALRPAIDPAAPAYVAYTSGSTGVPKGIVQSHAALAQFTRWFAGEFGIGPDSRVAQWSAPGYDASLMEVFAALTAGATLCPVPEGIRGNPDKMVAWLAAERVTVFQTVPSFAREIRRVLTAGAALPHLRVLLLAGEPLPGALANHLRALLPSIRLVNLYGPTETILATWHEVTGDVVGTVPIGRSIPGRHVVVLDEAGRPCPAGVTGDLVIRSPFVTPGYVGVEARPPHLFPDELSPDGFGIGPGPYYRTGDRARRRWDGALEFRGRTDLQIKFFGRRLELDDIEAALAEHESVAGCAVLPLSDQEGLVTRMVAYVVPRTVPGAPPATANVWRTHLRRRFGRVKLPLSFRTVDSLPRTPGGKVDRRRLPKPTEVADRAERRPPSTTEVVLGAVWRRLLGCHEVMGEDTFVGLGGHSLLLPRLAASIRDHFGVGVALWDLAVNPTLTDLAAAIDAALAATPDRHPP